MEFFHWPPGVVEELSPEYQDALLVIIAERRKAEAQPRPQRKRRRS
jgi:hypothetical protein